MVHILSWWKVKSVSEYCIHVIMFCLLNQIFLYTYTGITSGGLSVTAIAIIAVMTVVIVSIIVIAGFILAFNLIQCKFYPNTGAL